MKKSIKRISLSISFLSGNFISLTRTTIPVLLLQALCLTFFPLLSFIPFIILQAVVFTLHQTANSEGHISRVPVRKLYPLSFRNLSQWIAPKSIAAAMRQLKHDFSGYLSTFICCLFFFGFIAFMLSLPESVVLVVRHALDISRQLGDQASLPSDIELNFTLLAFAINVLLSILSIIFLLPYKDLEAKNVESEMKG